MKLTINRELRDTGYRLRTDGVADKNSGEEMGLYEKPHPRHMKAGDYQSSPRFYQG